MDSVKPVSLEDHLKVVGEIKERAAALPAEEVAEPDMPVTVFLDEAGTAAAAARQHLGDLAKVGLGEEAADALDACIKALASAQALWNTERRGGRSEAVAALIEECETCRQDLLDAADLALRNENDGKRRLSLIREGEGLADLIADLTDLAVLVTDFRPLFEEIRLDVDDASGQAAGLAKGLKSALAEEAVGKTLSGYKELRDRCYTLAKSSLFELRLFARYAFRKDKTNARRNLFTSAYLRSRDHRSRRKRAKAGAEPPAENPEPAPETL